MLLVVAPLVELYVLIQVGQVVGALWTIALLVLVSLVGAALLRREGARTWRAFRDATARGRVPAREVTDGALVLLGGALLLTPGFVTDVVGLLLVLPPTRAVVRRALTGLVMRRLLPSGPDLQAYGPAAGWPGAGPFDGHRGGPFGAGPAGRGTVPGEGRVVDGQVVDREPEA